jgi:O-antigen ligase
MMVALLAVLGAALPISIAPGLFFHYDATPKLILLILVMAAGFLRSPREIGADAASLWSRPTGRMLILLCAGEVFWFSLTTAASSRPRISLLGSGWREFGLAAIVSLTIVVALSAAHLARRKESIPVVLRAVTAAGIVSSLYGVVQYFGIDPLQNALAYRAYAGDAFIVRPPGTMGHADYFGWWLAVDLFCAVALIRIETGRWRTLGIVAAYCIGISTLLTGTRAALLAAIAGTVTLAILERTQLRARYLVLPAVSACLFAAFVISPPGARIRARIAWSQEEPAGGARPLLWRDTLRMVRAKPFLGFGPETFPAAFPRFESEQLASLYPDFHHESPHNLLLDALTSGGIPALLLTLGWGGLAVYAAVAARRARSALAAPLSAALVASAVASLFSSAVLAPLLLTALAIAVLIASQPTAEKVTVKIGAPLLLGFGAAALALLVFAVSLAVSDFRLERFQRHPSVATYAPRLIVPEDIYSSRMLAGVCREAPSQAAQMECHQTAVHAAARATMTADDPANAWYNLSLFTALQNDAAGTMMALRRATEAAPNWFKPHWTLAELLSRQGDPAAARSEAARAVTLDGNRNAEVSSTFFRLKEKSE